MADVKILLVEDESIEALDIKQTLESFGYKVPYVASSGEEAVEKALEIMPDLILMDIILKGDIDGIETVSKIKDLNIPVIYLTAHSEESTIERAKITEPYGYIIKPYDSTELKYAIELAIYKNQMQKELKKSEEKYRRIVENVLDAYFRGDIEGKITMASPSAAHMYGFDSPKEMIGISVLSLYKSSKDRKKMLENLKPHGKVLNMEGKALRKDGTSFWASMNVQYYYNKDGQIRGTEAFVRDISISKKAEEVLKKSESYYKAIFEHTGTATVILDENSTISLANTEFEKLSGYSKEELEGKKSWKDFIMKDDLLKMNEYHRLRRIDPQAAPKIYDFSFINRKGTIKNIHLNVDIIPGTKKSISSLLDVTSRKKAEKALLESEKSYRELVDNSLVGIYKTNLQGEILFVNDAMAKIFHYDNIDELKENNIIKLYKNSEDRLQFINKLKKDGHVTDYELETWGENGQSINTLVSASLKEDILSGMFMDITQLKRAEKNLLEDEKRFRTLINNSTDLIHILDKKGYIIFDSPSCTKILGYPEGSLIGKSPLEFIHPDDLERVKNNLAEVYENRNPGIPTEFKIRKADGEYLHVESISQNMIHVPNIEGIVVTTHLIQQRKEMENTLRESEEKYRTLFETDPNYTLLIETDGIIQDVNKATSDITSLSREELIGKHFIELELAIPEDIPVYVENITQILKGEQIKPFESQFRDKNGKIRWGFITLTPIIKDKSISSIMAIISDVTDRKVAENLLKTEIKEGKKMEKALRESEERYSITIDAINDGLWDWDVSSGDVFFSNNYYKMLGYDPGEFPANHESWRLLVHPDDIDSLEKQFQESIKLGRKFEIDLRIKTKSGKWLCVSTRGKEIEKDSTGNPIRIVGTLRDRTERVNAEKKIKESLEEKEILLKEIHHRVKNNLMIISSLLNLQSGYIKDKASQDIFKESQNRARSMAMIHERLYQSTDLKRIDFGEYISSLATELFHTYEADPGLIKLKIKVDNIFLDINTAIPLGLIVNELITNSLTHAFPKGKWGKINVDFHSKDDHYEFTVKDNGIGFPKDIDFQNTNSLGLQIVNSLTDQIDGKIKLDRTTGTEFKITFKELYCNKG
jgi:PAS domain S-box-containing protein